MTPGSSPDSSGSGTRRRLICRPRRSSWCSIACKGLVAKDPESLYLGGRTLKWLKVKQPKYREGERGWETTP